MITIKRVTFFAIILLYFFIAPCARSEDSYKDYYKSYNQAFQEGDIDGAIMYAESAWRAAEREIGDDQTTAILAYNYVQLIYSDAPSLAIEPIDRVIEIAGGKNEIFGPEDPALIKLYVLFKVNETDNKAIKALRNYIKARDVKDWPRNVLAARSWYALALIDLKKERHNSAKYASNLAIGHYTEAGQDLLLERAGVTTVAGVSRVAGRSRTNTDIEEAYSLFDEAAQYFGPQKSIDSFHPLLASTLTWRATTRAAVLTDGAITPRTGSRIKLKRLELEGQNIVRWQNSKPLTCVVNWSSRKPPKFPKGDANRGRFGSVLIGYNINENNEIIDERVLAEVPSQSEFGEASLEQIKSWQVESVEGGPECLRDQLTFFTFVLSG